MIIDVDPSWKCWLVEPLPEARCHVGWRVLIVETLAAFGAVMATGGDLRILEIKEKFAGLRIYVSTRGTDRSQDAKLFEIQRTAEERSYGICEVCGRPGEIGRERGWLRTRCREHGPGSQNH